MSNIFDEYTERNNNSSNKLTFGRQVQKKEDPVPVKRVVLGSRDIKSYFKDFLKVPKPEARISHDYVLWTTKFLLEKILPTYVDDRSGDIDTKGYEAHCKLFTEITYATSLLVFETIAKQVESNK